MFEHGLEQDALDMVGTRNGIWIAMRSLTFLDSASLRLRRIVGSIGR